MQTIDLRSLYIQSPKLNHLNILREVEANAKITQAELAKACSLSVAMVNNYMKEFCSSDLIEYHRKSVKSVTYHLTPSGTYYLEKLQSELMDEMVSMYVKAKEQIWERIINQAPSIFHRAVLYGCSHLAQLVFHALDLSGVKILGICDDNIKMIGSDFCGRQVLSPSQIRFLAPDAVIVADIERTEEICRNLVSLTDQGIVVIRLNEHPGLPSGFKPVKGDAQAAARDLDFINSESTNTVHKMF
jgi:predicted transcriptional regulator